MPSGFYNRVIRIIQHLPKGKVSTYGRIATLAGNPRAARQVPWILHSSSAKLGLPWWRVINSKGEISLSDPQDFAEQKSLLESEGVHFNETDTIHLEDARLVTLTAPDTTPTSEELEALHWRDRWDKYRLVAAKMVINEHREYK